jgi:hypothetical protein
MSADDKELERVILSRLLTLNAKVYGLVLGLSAGLGIFIATNWLVLKGGRPVGPHLALLNQFFIGYRVTFVGSVIGFVYAFACGFIVGYSVAWIYNRVVAVREKRGGR